MSISNYFLLLISMWVLQLGVAGRVAVFQIDDPSSIPGGVRFINLYSGTRYVPFVCVLSWVFSGGDPGILNTDQGRPAFVILSSVLVHSLAPPTVV